ncbi:hypothetical protein Taro_026234 [Colocasia esculenta]|uniref:Uncharacterized protein n=1 Tax=Colocasia esculenta TaxID=4460 RepID=A0A843VQS1_COLES|nr:hypothetical protein [Colocasia esculenta]
MFKHPYQRPGVEISRRVEHDFRLSKLCPFERRGVRMRSHRQPATTLPERNFAPDKKSPNATF